MYATAQFGHSLAKRLVEDPPQIQFPDYSGILAAIDILLFLPILAIIGYTLQHVYPTLAAVEDPLPAYEAVALNDDDGINKADDPVRGSLHPNKPITSSLRATGRLLRSFGSWRQLFRGLGWSVVVSLITGTTTMFFNLAPFIPARIAHLIALLALAPLSTAWTHLVITPPNATKSFASRIPPLRKVYLATWFPTFLLWAASHAAVLFPTLLAALFGLAMPTPQQPENGEQRSYPPPSASDIAKVACIVGVALALQAIFVVTSHTALTRVQASLLPADEDTVVPFDRSFGGRVEPEIISGRGFATFGAAIKTITFSSWVRIYLMRVKVFFVSGAAWILMFMIMGLQFSFLSKMSERRN